MSHPLIAAIQSRLPGITLHEAPLRGEDRLGGLMPYKRGTPKYALSADGQRLIGLNLAFTELTDAQWEAVLALPDFRPEHLEALNLSDNRLTRFMAPPEMRALRFLNLSDNPDLRSVSLPVPLPQLLRLDLSGGKIQELDLPPGCDALTHLDAGGNGLARIGFGGGMPALLSLELGKNQLEGLSLPSGFGSLKHLFLRDNQLQHVHFAQAPASLLTLDLRKNRLEQLPDNFLELASLEVLWVHGNPLSRIPQEHVSQEERGNSLANVRNYLRSISEDTPVPNDEIKLVLLGNSTSGKSTLLRYLRERAYDEDALSSTHGIKNEIWQIPEAGFQANVWDFGGQEFYHATHRLFLSQNSVALVLFEQATNQQAIIPTEIRVYEDGQQVAKTLDLEHFPFEYWLKTLQYFSPRMPAACLVQTKMDRPDAQGVEVPDQVRSEFQVPLDRIFRISVAGASGQSLAFTRRYEVFETDLISLLDREKGRYQISDKWVEIRNRLRALPAGEVMMDYVTYAAFCEAIRPGISQLREGETESMLDTLTEYLHETGVILYYRHIEALRRTVFVKPEWVTDAIYRVLDYQVMRAGGVFTAEHVARTAQHIPPDQLLALMKNFELIFETLQPGTYAAPQYLPLENPDKGSRSYNMLEESCCERLFVLRYPRVLPRSIMARFICRYGSLSKNNYWKTGILFKHGDTYVLAASQEGMLLTVSASVRDAALAKELFDGLCEISGQNPEIEVSVDGSQYVKVNELLGSPPANQQVRTVEDKWIDKMPFRILLGQPSGESDDSAGAAAPAIFFSYAWGAESDAGESGDAIVDELYDSLTQAGWKVERDTKTEHYGGLISRFMERLGRGQLIVVFVSERYMRSPYCMFELREIARNSRFEKEAFADRVLLVPLARIRFDRLEVLDAYFAYWKQELRKWEVFMIEYVGQVTDAQTRRFHIIQDIVHEFGKLADWITDINSGTLPLVSDQDFELIKRTIQQRIAQ